ncbi:tyrosine-type recombinase/integrase [Edaphobacter albus]|uniref:tyrosine-type recombinase/integrase n=1 Tax=Edaphobacter sp. 4G125 TaxID=2763071 RepID=UPI0016478592|nr:site-specific integrase [Edaphobacter sp. 4G125]QNI35451.1 site-specific integrase [Edaphobacter sp. 4G125]
MNRTELFIRERRYLLNVSEHTVRWYTCALKWLPSESPAQDELKDVVMAMRQKGLKESGCNAAIRAINAYLHWSSGTERKCGAGCCHPRIQPLKEPQIVLPTFSEEQVKRLIAWKPKARDFYERRLHLLILTLFDLGSRISEALGLRVSDINLDDLLATLNGKGRKQRIVPFSFVLRRALHRFIHDFGLKAGNLIFGNREGVQMSRVVALRQVKALCKRLGFEAPCRTLHSFRHLFAVNYLRRGGSLFHLQKTLGHTSLEMCRRYANLVTTDLQAVHERVTLLRAF